MRIIQSLLMSCGSVIYATPKYTEKPTKGDIMLIKWSKKRTSILLITIGYIMLGAMAWAAGQKFSEYFLDQAPAVIIQEESKPTRTCYFMRIQFVGSNQNGAELEVIEIPAECPQHVNQGETDG